MCLFLLLVHPTPSLNENIYIFQRTLLNDTKSHLNKINHYAVTSCIILFDGLVKGPKVFFFHLTNSFIVVNVD